LQVFAGAFAARIAAVLDHHAAPQDGDDRPGEDVVALPGRVVGLVQILLAHLAAPGRVEDGDVGIAARRDRALARIEAHDPGGVGGDEVDVAGERIAAPHHHLRVHHGETRLDAGVAAGGVVDAPAHGLLAQRAGELVGGDAVDG